MSDWIKYSLWCFHDLSGSRQFLRALCDCKLNFVAPALLNNMFFFSERLLMRSSLVLLQSKVWHCALWLSSVRWTWDNFQRHATYYEEGCYVKRLSCFRLAEITISLTSDSSRAFIQRLSGLFLLHFKLICHILTLLSNTIPFTVPLELKHHMTLDINWQAGISPENYWDTCHRGQCWSRDAREITKSEWVKDTAAVHDPTDRHKVQLSLIFRFYLQECTPRWVRSGQDPPRSPRMNLSGQDFFLWNTEYFFPPQASKILQMKQSERIISHGSCRHRRLLHL